MIVYKKDAKVTITDDEKAALLMATFESPLANSSAWAMPLASARRKLLRLDLPTHAYIPMYSEMFRMKNDAITREYRFIENDDITGPIAYHDQMQAKRIADAARKRFTRRMPFPADDPKFHVIGVTIR